jgi:hypothetical protein
MATKSCTPRAYRAGPLPPRTARDLARIATGERSCPAQNAFSSPAGPLLARSSGREVLVARAVQPYWYMDIAALMMLSVLIVTATVAVGSHSPLLGLGIVAVGAYTYFAFRRARREDRRKERRRERRQKELREQTVAQ